VPLYAKFEIPSEGFRIGHAFGQFPDVQVELDRVVPTTETVIPFISVRGADHEEVVRVTREEGAVEHIEAINVEDEWTLFRVVWNRAFRDAVVAIAEADLTLLAGTGTADRWQFEFRATSNDPLSAFRTYLADHGVPVTVAQVTELTTDREHHPSRLTESQLEALALAQERGYFDEPRAVKLEALAAEVGISRQAFGGRLRRGIRNLLVETDIHART
jgi:predicted DNA binding protein